MTTAFVNMGIFGAESLNPNGGQKPTVKRAIYQLMKDGRERTTIDICNALGRSTWSLRVSTNEALRNMWKQGVLSKTTIQNVPVWKIASAQEQLAQKLAQTPLT